MHTWCVFILLFALGWVDMQTKRIYTDYRKRKGEEEHKKGRKGYPDNRQQTKCFGKPENSSSDLKPSHGIALLRRKWENALAYVMWGGKEIIDQSSFPRWNFFLLPPGPNHLLTRHLLWGDWSAKRPGGGQAERQAGRLTDSKTIGWPPLCSIASESSFVCYTFVYLSSSGKSVQMFFDLAGWICSRYITRTANKRQAPKDGNILSEEIPTQLLQQRKHSSSERDLAKLKLALQLWR